jgi:hypothetical protein
LGPYNDSFVKTEVEVSESKIDAIRETVNEMRRYGVHVSSIKLMIFIKNCSRLLQAIG